MSIMKNKKSDLHCFERKHMFGGKCHVMLIFKRHRASMINQERELFRNLWQRLNTLSKIREVFVRFVARCCPSIFHRRAYLLNECLHLCDNGFILCIVSLTMLCQRTRYGHVSFPFFHLFLFLNFCSVAAPSTLHKRSVFALCCWVMPSLCHWRLGSDLSAIFFVARQCTPECSFKDYPHLFFEFGTFDFAPCSIVIYRRTVAITMAHAIEC